MITTKRGDTLTILVVRKDSEGDPMTGDALKLKAQLRTATDKLLADFAITETAVLGTYELSIPSSVAKTFEIGMAYWDLQYNDGAGNISSSDTVEIEILKDITYE